ncbi:hypothetical protein JZ751_029091 [Albula glossodonta]|uniref:Uncharacterized protein n=1 Tax=Albula glossodonta TaxID=121402 RepID=A0A8T2P849_9TELE|nr:hypothetical protein JZ751_029091 [Albula glossodonta]
MIISQGRSRLLNIQRSLNRPPDNACFYDSAADSWRSRRSARRISSNLQQWTG